MTIVIAQPRQFSIRRYLNSDRAKDWIFFYQIWTYNLRLEKWRSRQDVLSIFTTTKEIIVNVTLVRPREAQHLIKEKVSHFSFYEVYTYAFHFYSVVLKPIYRWTKLNFPGELLNFLEAGKFFGLERLH
mgnify:CR=1 FL=1